MHEVLIFPAGIPPAEIELDTVMHHKKKKRGKSIRLLELTTHNIYVP